MELSQLDRASGPISTAADTVNHSAMPRDNAALADSVATLFREGRQGEATAMLDAGRQGQPQAVQDALDRMVSTRVGASMIPGSAHGVQSMYASPVDIGNTLRRVNEAGNDPPAMPNVTNLNEQQKFDVYSSIVGTRGDQAAIDSLANGDRVIVGLRSEDSSLANQGRGLMNDRIVVLSRDAAGTPTVSEFNRASTEPTAQYDGNQRTNPEVARFRRAEGDDVTGDGVPELGRLGEGTTELLQTTHANPAQAGTNFSLRPTPQAVTDGAGRVDRDANHDGVFDSADVPLGGRADLNSTFKIHSSSRANTDSAGCTTIHPEDYAAFRAAVTADGNQSRWQYVLSTTTP